MGPASLPHGPWSSLLTGLRQQGPKAELRLLGDAARLIPSSRPPECVHRPANPDIPSSWRGPYGESLEGSSTVRPYGSTARIGIIAPQGSFIRQSAGIISPRGSFIHRSAQPGARAAPNARRGGRRRAWSKRNDVMMLEMLVRRVQARRQNQARAGLSIE